MKIKVEKRHNALELIPEGKLDIDSGEEFEEKCKSQALDSAEKTIGINLEQIEYIDSSGLGTLIKVLNLAKNDGKQLLVFGAPPKVQNVFQLARLEKFFTFTDKKKFSKEFPTEADAEIDSMIDNI